MRRRRAGGCLPRPSPAGSASSSPSRRVGRPISRCSTFTRTLRAVSTSPRTSYSPSPSQAALPTSAANSTEAGLRVVEDAEAARLFSSLRLRERRDVSAGKCRRRRRPGGQRARRRSRGARGLGRGRPRTCSPGSERSLRERLSLDGRIPSTSRPSRTAHRPRRRRTAWSDRRPGRIRPVRPGNRGPCGWGGVGDVGGVGPGGVEVGRVRVVGGWLRGQDLNLRPSGYEPDELPGCSTPRRPPRAVCDGPGTPGDHPTKPAASRGPRETTPCRLRRPGDPGRPPHEACGFAVARGDHPVPWGGGTGCGHRARRVERGCGARDDGKARQRPTLPCLEAQYHGRCGVSRPSSGWDRVGHPRWATGPSRHPCLPVPSATARGPGRSPHEACGFAGTPGRSPRAVCDGPGPGGDRPVRSGTG